MNAILIGTERFALVIALPYSSKNVSFEIGASWDEYTSYTRLAFFLLLFVVEFRFVKAPK